MGLFGFSKKDNVLDLAERYKRQKEIDQAKESSFRDSAGEDGEKLMNASDSPEERRRKLAKRLIDMTTSLEDLSNQIYHLQQRLEVLEKKLNVRIE